MPRSRSATAPPTVDVSVVIPVYNADAFIARTLDSVLAQTHQCFEIVVVDDGSTDASRRIAEARLARSGVRHTIVDQPNQGVAAARNQGIASARGEFVFFLDSDDVLHPDCLAALVATARRHESDVALCGFESFDREGRRRKVYRRFGNVRSGDPGHAALRAFLAYELTAWTASCLYRRQFLVDHDLRVLGGIAYGEAYEYIARALYHARRVAVVDRILAQYRLRSASLTASLKVDAIDKFRAVTQLRRHIEAHGGEPDLLHLLTTFTEPMVILEPVAILLARDVPTSRLRAVLADPEIAEALTRFSPAGRRSPRNLLIHHLLLSLRYLPRLGLLEVRAILWLNEHVLGGRVLNLARN